MADKFEPVQCVKLISGGPPMTIIDAFENCDTKQRMYTCRWFIDETLMSDYFFEFELKSCD